MKLYIYIITLMLFLFSSCDSIQQNQTNSPSDENNIAHVKLPPEEEIVIIESWDSATIVGEAILWRSEKIEGSEKWTSVSASNIFGFKNEVKVGSEVQLIPLTMDLPIINLEVTICELVEDYGEAWYNIKLANIENKAYWNYIGPEERRAEFPVDFMLVYPPVENCTLLNNSEYKAEDIPKQYEKKLVKGALDFNKDGKPDAIIFSYCCKNKSHISNCDYTCQEVFIKSNNKWIRINSSKPL